MGRKMVYVATRLADYKRFHKDDEFDNDIVDLVGEDTLYDNLERTPEGVDFVDSIQTVDEFDGRYGWLTANPALVVEDVGEYLKTRFQSSRAKEEWFRKPYDAYVKELQAVIRGTCIDNFAKYELLSPDFVIKRMYSRQWDGYVAVLGPTGCVNEFDYPMEFLRRMRPRETWLVSKKGWIYK